MQPHQDRVVAEKSALDDSRNKLATFIVGDVYPALDAVEQHRLTYQLQAMNLYATILGDRIAAFV